MLVGGLLGTLWVTQVLNFVFSGHLPAIIVAVQHPTNVIAALDLTFVVSVLLLGAFWLWQHRPWGYILATIATIKGSVYTLALAASSASAALAGINGTAEQIPLWGFLSVTSLVVCVTLILNLHDTREASHE